MSESVCLSVSVGEGVVGSMGGPGGYSEWRVECVEVKGWEACVVLLMPLSLSFSVSDTWGFWLLTHLRVWVCVCVFVSMCLCGCVLACAQHVRSPVRMGLG